MIDSQIIHQDLIFLDQDLGHKNQIIQYIAQQAKVLGYVMDDEAFYTAVMQREEEVPTSIGYDIAMPHGKSSAVVHPFIAFFRTKNKFKWTEGVGDEVQLIFQIGVPKEGSEKLHLKFISQVSKKLLDEVFREKLRTIKDTHEIYKLLSEIDI